MADVEVVEADVCVVGAGYAGLTAARRLTAEGRTVVVLEARDRVGGRVWTDTLPDGVTTVDRGAGWLAPEHTAARGLAASLGVSLYKTWNRGRSTLTSEGRLQTYRGLIPKISPLAVLSIARNQRRIDRWAATVPLDAPWTAARAAQWDQETVADFLARTGIRSKAGRDLFDMAVRGLFTGPHDDTSLLNLLFLAHSHGSINTLFTIEGGSQDSLVAGGAGTMARLMADSLDVRLGQPVRSVMQGADWVAVHTAGSVPLKVVAPHVVVAIPPVLIGEIAWDPMLPPERAELYQRAVAGPESKTLVVYETPFWREDGFNGQSSEPGSASETTLDASPVDASVGVLASFTFGSVAASIDELPVDSRRDLVVSALVQRYGPRAASPVAFVETAWWKEEWTRGCSMAHFPPGVLTRLGHLLREPWQRIHWAGTETATVSHGAIDGAVRSGERAALEILDRS